ncbi:MAG: HD domain-containing protein [Anaerolineae bacterium]
MSYNPDLISTTWWFAAEAHGDQKVPSSELPYLTHIGNVMLEVMGACENSYVERPDLAVQCAILHDVIEDTPTAVDNVEALFGPQVTAGVLALTKDKSMPTKQEQMIDSLNRIQKQPHEVWMVKMADRISNLRYPPSHWSVEKAAAYRTEAQLIWDALHEANDFLADRLADKIEAYQQWLA